MSDTLAVWAPADDVQYTALSFATAPPGSSEDLAVRIKNVSNVYTAFGVTVSASGTNANDLYFSFDGFTYATTLSLGDLLPSVISPPITVRRVTPSTEGTGAKTATLNLQVTSWSA